MRTRPGRRGADLRTWPQPQARAPDPGSTANLCLPPCGPEPRLTWTRPQAPDCRLGATQAPGPRTDAHGGASRPPRRPQPRRLRPPHCTGAAWRRRLQASLPPELVRTTRTRGKRQTPAPPPARVAHGFGPWKDHGLPSWPRGCPSWGRRVRPCCPGPQARSGSAGGLAGGTFLRGPSGPQPAPRRCREERGAAPPFSFSALRFCWESCGRGREAEAGDTRGLLLQWALPLSRPFSPDRCPCRAQGGSRCRRCRGVTRAVGINFGTWPFRVLWSLFSPQVLDKVIIFIPRSF
uniref:Uncharacterized protein n=1 Tax=Rousettus aegyptiacus TaxID=9407 RepID=A0A7J8JGY9_ROUAE|nr:hypothetical protein HJG63_010391 [Rousettus aegyptiacus]